MTGRADPVVEHWSALESDLARFYHVTPQDLQTMSWRRFLCLAGSLWAVEGSLWVAAQRQPAADRWAPEPNMGGKRNPADIVHAAFAGARKVKA